MPKSIRQVVFNNGEKIEAIQESFRALGLRLVQVIDMDQVDLYPIDRSREPSKPRRRHKLDPGGLTLEFVPLDFDVVIIVYLHPSAPGIECVYYAKTERIPPNERSKRTG